jgi:hypothetical protein
LDNLPVWEFDILYDQVVAAMKAEKENRQGLTFEP